MHIDISKYKTHWFEDEDCNIIESSSDDISSEYKDKTLFYYSCFPCRIVTDVSHYDYHPEGINKFLIKIPFLKERVKKRIGKTFKHFYSIQTVFSRRRQKLAVAMVNSGDYDLDQALWILANSCERCSNVLERKYLGKGHGYEEYSEDWKKCNTVCKFCENERIPINLPDFESNT